MTEREPLQILQSLGDELERATLADERAGAARRRRFHLPGLPMMVLIAAVSVTGVAAAATHLFGLASPVSAPPRADVPAESRPLPSTVVMAGINASDPDGLPSWDVRVSRSATGEVCTAVGQTQNGIFGILGLDQKFRALPLGAADACVLPPKGGTIAVGARTAIGSSTMSARTLVVGVAGPGVKRLFVETDKDRPIPVGRDGAFVAVLKGLPDAVQPTVGYTTIAEPNYPRYVNLASDDRDITRDPAYGRPDWEFRTGPERKFVFSPVPARRSSKPQRVCVSARQAEDPTSAGTDADYFPAQTPTTCWPAKHAPVVMSARRLVPTIGGYGPFTYGLNPARTVVQGIAGPDVKSISIPAGDDHTGVLSLGPIAHGAPDFLWVYDGKVDPNGITLDVVLKNGKRLSVRSSGQLIDPMGAPYAMSRAPAWQDVAALKAQLGDGTFTQKTAGSDGLSATVPNPAGGPAWAAHSWLAVSKRPASPNDHEPLVCASYGPVVGGAVRTTVGMRVTDAEPTGRAIQCTPDHPAALRGPKAPAAFASLFPKVYLDDPSSPAPHVAFVAMTGLFPGVTAAQLELHRGHVLTTATVGPHGATLALLPPSYAAPGTELRWHLTYASGRRITTDWASASPAQRHAPPAVRAADPGGAAGWALQSTTLRDPTMPGEPGQMIGRRIGMIDASTGQVIWPNGSRGAAPTSRAHPVSFNVESMLDSPANQPGVAQVQRRIAPGRTVVFGHVYPGTRTVTIQTPRDVRTVRPSPKGGLFLAVYDGRFTQGRITVTAGGPGIRGSATQSVNP